jgi:hypothetical protein
VNGSPSSWQLHPYVRRFRFRFMGGLIKLGCERLV